VEIEFGNGQDVKKMKEFWKLSDGKNTYSIDENIWIGADGELLQIQSPFNKRFLFYTDHEYQGLWKFNPQLPVFNKENIVSFGEGYTPVVKELWHQKQVSFKLEYLFPTGSYKDRGATVLLSKIKELGIKKIIEDSSGNAGCAIAAYAAKANIDSEIYVSSMASPAKIKQMKGYGANVIVINGSREDVAEAAKKAAQHAYYASHSYNPFFFEGTKTFAYEVWEQCPEMPDEIIFPVGNGTLIIGTYIGFTELMAAGLITQIPRLSAAQATHCPGLSNQNINEFKTTVAEGIAVKNPVRKMLIQKILGQTNGLYYAVNEEDILKEHQLLHKNGYFVELTSAVATAALQQSSGNKVMVPLTGHGLKNL
jgi:threonine synthase